MRNATQRNATQRNATQRNATQRDTSPAILRGRTEFGTCRPFRTQCPGIGLLLANLVILSLPQFGFAQPYTYFVSASIGNNSYDGKSSTVILRTPPAQHGGPFKTIQHAANMANNGDVIYVAAGEYGQLNEIGLDQSQWDRDGVTITDNNVSFIGYNIEPGDLNSGSTVPATFDAVLSNQYQAPLLKGISRNSHVGFLGENRNYTRIMNFRIEDFWTGVSLNGVSCQVYNVVGARFGNPAIDFHGNGMSIGGSLNSVWNCVVFNSAANGIAINSQYSTIDSCRVYCNDNVGYGPTDYYFVICGHVAPNNTAMMNTISNCKCERRYGPNGFPSHGGAGFAFQGLKSTTPSLNEITKQNTVQDCHVKGMTYPFHLRGANTEDNKILRCTADVTASGAPPGMNDLEMKGSISLAGGVRNNRFSRVWLTSALAAVSIYGMPEEYEETEYAAYGNEFENCIFHNCERAFDLQYRWTNNDGEGTEQDVFANKFTNCTFAANPSKTTHLFWANRQVAYNQVKNCIFVNFDQVEGDRDHANRRGLRDF
jgi:hypothetical protein